MGVAERVVKTCTLPGNRKNDGACWLSRGRESAKMAPQRRKGKRSQLTNSFSKREHSGSASALSLESVPPGLAPRAEALRSASEPLPSSLGPGLSEPACQGASGLPEARWVSWMRGWVGCKPDVLGARLSPGRPLWGATSGSSGRSSRFVIPSLWWAAVPGVGLWGDCVSLSHPLPRGSCLVCQREVAARRVEGLFQRRWSHLQL